MGWNDIRVSLVPLGRKVVAKADPSALTTQGQPVLILHTAAELDHHSPAQNLQACRSWLEESGFQVVQSHLAGIRMTRGDVEAFLVAEAETLAEIILTFTLSRQSLDRLAEWQRLVADICPVFSLALVNCRNQKKLTDTDFVHLIRSQPQWLDAAERWGWSETNDFAGAQSSIW